MLSTAKTVFFVLLIFVTALFSACSKNDKSEKSRVLEAPKSEAVEVSRDLFFNADSLLYYAELAYLHEDPQGLYVTGAACYMKLDGLLPDSLTTVRRDEADIMLLRAAQLGHADALQLIRCLDGQGMWRHSIPEPLNDK